MSKTHHWIDLPIPLEVAREIVVEGGQAAGKLHVTLAYLGTMSEGNIDEDPELLEAAIIGKTYRWARLTPAFPVTITGIGHFPPPDGGPHGSGTWWRGVRPHPSAELFSRREELCRAIDSIGHGVRVSRDFGDGWIPHVSICQGPPKGLGVGNGIGAGNKWPCVLDRVVYHAGDVTHEFTLGAR